MNTLKKGDRVVCVDAKDCDLIEGVVYTVAHPLNEGIHLYNVRGHYESSRFRKLPEPVKEVIPEGKGKECRFCMHTNTSECLICIHKSKFVGVYKEGNNPKQAERKEGGVDMSEIREIIFSLVNSLYQKNRDKSGFDLGEETMVALRRIVESLLKTAEERARGEMEQKWKDAFFKVYVNVLRNNSENGTILVTKVEEIINSVRNELDSHTSVMLDELVKQLQHESVGMEVYIQNNCEYSRGAKGGLDLAIALVENIRSKQGGVK